MRDPSQYAEHHRNDPLSDEQRRDHPYDFVSLPAAPVRGNAVGHHKYPADRLTGRLTLVYETLTPLHVGSGVFETAAQCGLAGDDQPVRGITRRLGLPVLPGSSWKGAVRARFEAITRSCLGVAARPLKMDSVKLPEALWPERERRAKVKIELRDPRLGALKPPEVGTSPQDLSPADALFGAMGYRGRVHPSEGVIEEGPWLARSLSVPPLESPAPHRLAKPGAARRVRDGIEIAEVEGRKFYYDGPLLEGRVKQSEEGPAHEDIDAVPARSRITIDVHLEAVTEAELGALLISAGHGKEVGIVRFGGYKPAGLGKVRLIEITGELRRGCSLRRWQRSEPEPFDLDHAVQTARETGLIDASALAELHAVNTRTRP
jgi:CRISPR/Cas system CSM-associated protein Csm3 (group 7 of RAMP superfamily)